MSKGALYKLERQIAQIALLCLLCRLDFLTYSGDGIKDSGIVTNTTNTGESSIDFMCRIMINLIKINRQTSNPEQSEKRKGKENKWRRGQRDKGKKERKEEK